MTTSVLVTSSEALTGRLPGIASKQLVDEVFSIMHHDEIGTLARKDKTIIMVGNTWLLRNQGNELKRGQYTSQVMRLMARLLKYLRQLNPLDVEEAPLTEYLHPQHFDLVIEACLMCASVHMDDLTDLETPSNAIKLGHDIRRACGTKLGLAIRQTNDEHKKEAKDFLKLMDLEWSLRVTKLARLTLNKRFFNNRKSLPKPEDLMKLSTYMENQLEGLDMRKPYTLTQFDTVSKYTLAKLFMYNRHRSGAHARARTHTHSHTHTHTPMHTHTLI